MNKYSQEQIQQALFINQNSDIVSHIDRERSPEHAQVLQLFVIKGETRTSQLFTCYLPREGGLVVHTLIPLRLHHAVSNVTAYRNRLQYVQVSLDNKEVMTNDDVPRRIVRNTNPFEVSQFMMPSAEGASGKAYSNPWNSVFVSGFFRLVPVPHERANDALTAKFNKASARLRLTHQKLVEASPDADVTSNPKYREVMEALYKEYQNNMMALINSGEVVLTQAISVADNSFIPSITKDSEMEMDNPFLNSVGHLKTDISYTSTLNKFFGYATVNSGAKADDVNPQLTTGLRNLGKNEDKGEEDVNTSRRQECTVLGSIFDTFGNKSSILIRRQDQGYINPNATNSVGLAETFKNNTSNNESLFITGQYLPIVANVGVGGNSNGITRATVLVENFTKHRQISNVSSIDGNIDIDEFAESFDAEAFLKGEANFTIENNTSQELMESAIDEVVSSSSQTADKASKPAGSSAKSKPIL